MVSTVWSVSRLLSFYHGTPVPSHFVKMESAPRGPLKYQQQKVHRNRKVFRSIYYDLLDNSFWLCLRKTNSSNRLNSEYSSDRFISCVCSTISDYNECSTNPCRSAPCVDGIQLYTCQCPANRTGSICERCKILAVRYCLLEFRHGS